MSSLTAAQFRSLFEMAGGEDISFLFGDDEAAAVAAPVELQGKRGWEEVDQGEGSGAVAAKRQRSPTSSRENSSGSNEGGQEEVSEAAAAMAAAVGRGGGRRLWVKERDSEWWDMVSSPDYPDSEFRKAFRMSKATFEVVCDELAAAVAKEDTMLRAAIPVRKRVAVCVWRLATGEPLRLVSKRFGLGISTCHKLVLEVCAALKAMVMPKVVRWPEAGDAAAIAAHFEAISGISGVVGAIYTTHIPIIAPKSNVASYYNRRHTERNQKTSYSMTVQCVVDSTGAFTDVCIGWPGSNSDEEVLEKSALYLHRGVPGLIQGQWVVGGGSFPLMDWMLVPYTHQNLTWAQHMLNEKVAAVRGVARDAFERLKRRWGCLQKRTEVKLLDLPTVLGACCVLHNICERSGDAVVDADDCAFDLFDDDMVAENAVRSSAAAQARDAIAHNLLHSGGGASFF
ncbi:protein ANTAGONIST OF LIKE HETEROCHROMATIN PROTEIN 1 [Oryza sativa Japonica Group]|uniref:Os01g0186900 protein n=4 Tax=Oryza sativa subsp. japonica TaxID=39947 RepID=B7EXU7_ORYSJ|nr:protein ANTAGONIST OF LIKE HETEROCHROMATIN PROTEIN 1 [Oryza sativa Japonica Group]BAG97194.1 unnamed protein product [Oryza sativa Japonica Group]BAS70789.1 Os01g0186900 [Oryza sativa Japonica Group]